MVRCQRGRVSSLRPIGSANRPFPLLRAAQQPVHQPLQAVNAGRQRRDFPRLARAKACVWLAIREALLLAVRAIEDRFDLAHSRMTKRERGRCE